MGDKRYSNFAQARVAFADELSGALGFGSATDMSREMGFDLTRTDLSPEQFNAGINDIVIPFIAQKRSTILDQMGIYGNTVNSFSATNKTKSGQPFDYNGAKAAGYTDAEIQEYINSH